MNFTQSLRGEQSKAQTRKKIAIAVAQTMTNNQKTIAAACGLSVGTVRKNADHVALILSQEIKKQSFRMKPYTTSRGTKISQRILCDLMDSISKGDDYQRSITDHLRDVIPVHDDDLDEANEVYNHVEAVMDEPNPCLAIDP